MKIGRYFILLILVIPVLILRDFTPNNELKYLSIVDEALRNGHFFTFYHQGELYADKPPFYFWLLMLDQMASTIYFETVKKIHEYFLIGFIHQICVKVR